MKNRRIVFQYTDIFDYVRNHSVPLSGNYYYIQVLQSAVIPASVADILSREWMSLQTSEKSREINKKDMARVWVLSLEACITPNCPTMCRSDKHLVIVKA